MLRLNRASKELQGGLVRVLEWLPSMGFSLPLSKDEARIAGFLVELWTTAKFQWVGYKGFSAHSLWLSVISAFPVCGFTKSVFDAYKSRCQACPPRYGCSFQASRASWKTRKDSKLYNALWFGLTGGGGERQFIY